MPNMKIDPDIKRFTRYQSLIKILLIRDSFCKSEIYESLPLGSDIGNSLSLNQKRVFFVVKKI